MIELSKGVYMSHSQDKQEEIGYQEEGARFSEILEEFEFPQEWKCDQGIHVELRIIDFW